MRPVTVVAGASPASSPPVVVDQYISPCNIAVGCIVTGGITFLVEHTFDDPFAPGFDPATAIWLPHPTLLGSANIDGNYLAPPRAIRVRTTAGAGSVSMRVNQAGIA